MRFNWIYKMIWCAVAAAVLLSPGCGSSDGGGGIAFSPPEIPLVPTASPGGSDDFCEGGLIGSGRFTLKSLPVEFIELSVKEEPSAREQAFANVFHAVFSEIAEGLSSFDRSDLENLAYLYKWCLENIGEEESSWQVFSRMALYRDIKPDAFSLSSIAAAAAKISVPRELSLESPANPICRYILFDLSVPDDGLSEQAYRDWELFAIDQIMEIKALHLTAELPDVQSKCIAVARWVSSQISNRRNSSEVFTSNYAQRFGLCRTRANLFIHILEKISVKAVIYNLYNVNHTCVQVWYDGAWHFFDVTYAGVFLKNGWIMSWDEIMQAGEDSSAFMQVFPDTLDRETNGKRVENTERMERNYDPSHLAFHKTFGFLKDGTVKVFYPEIDFSSEISGYTFAALDGTYTDFTDRKNQSMEDFLRTYKIYGIKEVDYMNFYYLGWTLNNVSDDFAVVWTLRNCEPGALYEWRYDVYDGFGFEEICLYKAESSGGDIVSGGEFSSAKIAGNGTSDCWVIRVMAQDSTVALRVGYDFREKGGVCVDRISVRKIQ